MKKKLLLIAFSLLFVVSGITLYFTNQNINTYADSVPTASGTYDVNFIAPDNSILYSTGYYVPSGSSLSDLQNSNIITQSYFSSLDSIPSFTNLNSWSLSSGVSYSINSEGLLLNSQSFSSNKYLIYYINMSDYYGKKLVFSVCVNGIIYTHSYIVPSSFTSTTGSGQLVMGNTGLGLRFFCYNSSSLGLTVDIISSRFTGPVTISWSKCEVGDSFTGYYNSEYINHLLLVNNFSDYYYNLDLSQPIISNKYFYPIETNTLYDKGYSDGVDYATEMLQGFGIFNYSTYSLVNRFDYNELIGSFTGRVTEDNFVKFNGGFIIGSELFSSIDDYLYDNEISDVVLKFDFDSNISVKTSPYFIFYNFSFGNQVEFIFSDGSKLSLNSADSKFDSVSLDNYTNSYIKSIVLGFSSNFADYGQVGISSNVNYSNAYNNGLTDGFNIGYDNGYLTGSSDGVSRGYNSGYSDGLADGGNYSFFSLFGAVLDAPVKTLTGLFNFDLLGINLWNLFTALFTLAFIILIIKLCLGGK